MCQGQKDRFYTCIKSFFAVPIYYSNIDLHKSGRYFVFELSEAGYGLETWYFEVQFDFLHGFSL